MYRTVTWSHLPTLPASATLFLLQKVDSSIYNRRQVALIRIFPLQPIWKTLLWNILLRPISIYSKIEIHTYVSIVAKYLFSNIYQSLCFKDLDIWLLTGTEQVCTDNVKKMCLQLLSSLSAENTVTTFTRSCHNNWLRTKIRNHAFSVHFSDSIMALCKHEL